MYVTYGAVGVGLLIGIVLIMKLSGGSSANAKDTAQRETPPAQSRQLEIVPADKPAPTPAVTEPKSAVKPPEPAAVTPAVPEKTDAPATETKAAQPEVAEQKEPEKKQAVDLLDLGTPRKAARSDDDDGDVKTARKKPADATQKAPEAAKADSEKPEKGAMAGALDLVTNKKDKEEKAMETKKVAGPTVPAPPAPSSAEEPLVVPLDFAKVDGGDRAFAQTLGGVMPGWRVRDIHFDGKAKKPEETTNLGGLEFRGRTSVVVLNPNNDVQSAKLLATIDIPAKFRGLRPTLNFEVSTKDPGHSWALQVNAANSPILPKSPVKTKAKEAWNDTVVDLSSFAGKRFELVIEAYMLNKSPRTFPEQLAFIRNVHLEWTGHQPTKK